MGTLQVVLGPVKELLRALAVVVSLVQGDPKVHVEREGIDVLELERPEQRPTAVTRAVLCKVAILDQRIDEAVRVAGRGALPNRGESRRVLARLSEQAWQGSQQEGQAAQHGVRACCAAVATSGQGFRSAGPGGPHASCLFRIWFRMIH